jgi:UDP-N-acetylglucosamine acyltransferase
MTLLAPFFRKRSVSDQSVVLPILRATTGPRISPLAAVDPKARIGDDCEIGPFCVVGPDVTLGSGCKLLSHVIITGHTTIGCDNIFHPHCVIGGIPQDKKYRGENTLLTFVDRNDFREAVTVHLGTEQGGGITSIGDQNLLMVNCHIAHDCRVGSNNVLGNNVMLAGHIVIGHNVVMSGGAAAHHFVTIGDYAFIAGVAQVNKDVPPFMKLSARDHIRSVNTEGLRRAGFTEEDISEIEEAGRKLFFNREKPTFAAAMAEFDLQNGIHPQVKHLVEFMARRNSGKHGRYLESLRQKK